VVPILRDVVVYTGVGLRYVVIGAVPVCIGIAVCAAPYLGDEAILVVTGATADVDAPAEIVAEDPNLGEAEVAAISGVPPGSVLGDEWATPLDAPVIERAEAGASAA